MSKPREGMFDVEGAREVLGFEKKRSVYRLVQERRITHYRYNGRVYFNPQDLDDYLDQHRVPAIR